MSYIWKSTSFGHVYIIFLGILFLQPEFAKINSIYRFASFGIRVNLYVTIGSKITVTVYYYHNVVLSHISSARIISISHRRCIYKYGSLGNLFLGDPKYYWFICLFLSQGGTSITIWVPFNCNQEKSMYTAWLSD